MQLEIGQKDQLKLFPSCVAMLELEVSFGSDTYLTFDKRRLTVAHNLLSKLGIVTFVLRKSITSRQNLSLIKTKINFLTV